MANQGSRDTISDENGNRASNRGWDTLRNAFRNTFCNTLRCTPSRMAGRVGVGRRCGQLFVMLTILATTACQDAFNPSNRTELRVINAIPGNQTIRASMDGMLVASALTHADFTACREVEPGTYRMTASTSGSAQPVFDSAGITFQERGKYMIFATGRIGDSHFAMVKDEYPRPRVGHAKVRIFNALRNQPVDVYFTGEGEPMGSFANVGGLPFNQATGFYDVPAQRTNFIFTEPGDPGARFEDTGAFMLESQSIWTVVVSERTSSGGVRTFTVPNCI